MSDEQKEVTDVELEVDLSIPNIVTDVGIFEEVVSEYNESKDFEKDLYNADEQADSENASETQSNIENVISENRAEQVTTPKPNRDLKSILELSKEAKLDTNIGHKRKSLEPGGNQPEKSEMITRRRKSCILNCDNQKQDIKKLKDSLEKNRDVCDAESSSSISDNFEDEGKETIEKDEININSNKRKRRKSESSVMDAIGKRGRRLSTNRIIIINNKKKDPFCWRCHHLNVNVHCETCPRSFHTRCLKQSTPQSAHWLCPECVIILKAENLKQRSPAMKDISLEHLCGLLKFAVQRMADIVGCEPFIHPVNENEFPEYKNYIVQPMDLTCLEMNIKDNVYGSTQAFEADAKWLLHNSIIFNSYQSKLTTIAKYMIKICKQEMSEIENCPNCYLNANTKKNTWFVEVCPKPHLLVWAKLKGFPYWPAKAMRTNSQGFVDVRFFGAHDRAWVPFKECFVYSLKDPNSSKLKRNDIIESIKELNIYIDNLKKVYGDFRYAPYKEIFEPESETRMLQFMLPKYNPDEKLKQASSSNGTANASDIETDRERSTNDSEISEENKETIELNKNNSNDMMNTDDEDKSFYELETIDKASTLTKAEVEAIILSSNKNTDNSSNSVTSDSSTYSSSPTVRGRQVGTRGGYANTSGRIKVIPKGIASEIEIIRKLSCNTNETETCNKVNTEQDDKDDSSHPSNISDKINIVNISEGMEIPLGNDSSGDSIISENIPPVNELCELNLPEIIIKTKHQPVVQVIGTNENSEFTTSPQSKPKITDKLMKKLSESQDDASKIERVEKQITDNADEHSEKSLLNISNSIAETNLLLDNIKNKNLTVLEKITELSPDMEIFETTTEIEKSSDVEYKENNENYEDTKDSQETNTSANDEEKKTNNEDLSLQNSIVLEVIVNSDNYDKEESRVVSSTSSAKSNKSGSTEDKAESDNKSKTTESIITPHNAENSSGVQNLSNLSNAISQKKVKEVVGTNHVPKQVLSETTSLNQVEIKLVSGSSPKKLEKPIPHKSQVQLEPTAAQVSKKRKHSTDKEDLDKSTESPLQKRLITVVSIEEIKKKDLNDCSINNDKNVDKSILLDRLNLTKPDNSQDSKESESTVNTTNTAIPNMDSIEIKNEPPSSDDEPSDNEYMELKTQYLSALNLNKSDKLAEKPKQNEIRTRSKTEEKRFPVDNLSKIIDEVATHYSAEHANEEITLPAKRKEIFIKPLSKMQMPKQKARKSFPMPSMSPMPPMKSYPPVQKKDIAKVTKPSTTSTVTTTITTVQKTVPLMITTSKPIETSNNIRNVMFIAPPLPAAAAVTNTITLLPPNQPITYTANITNPVLTMVQHPIGTTLSSICIPPTVSQVSQPVPTNEEPSTELLESQNFIPQSGELSNPTTTATSTCTSETSVTIIPPLVSLSQTTTTNSTAISNRAENTNTRPVNVLEELQGLSSILPETLTASISEIMCRGPPTLKPRPPGPLSMQFEEGLPSSTGTLTNRINSISHRLADYLRGMLVELLTEMGKSGYLEAENAKLKLENEELKHKYSEEILEIKKNIRTILDDVQKSVTDDRNRLIDETRSACEAECVKRVEEAKSKQWCSNCSKEAQFYCCWNTSYCDYPCQQKHWTKHMSKCTQNSQNSQLQVSNPTIIPKPQTQSLLLRPTTAPKNFTKALIAKPTKVFVKGANKNAFNLVRTSGNQLTLVEATPGNFEFVGNGGPISIGGKFITTMGKIKTTNVLSVTSPSSSNSVITTNSEQGEKSTLNVPSSSKTLEHSKTVTILSDDESA